MAAVPQAVVDILWQQAQQYQMAGVQAVLAVTGQLDQTTVAALGEDMDSAVLAVLAVRMALLDQQADRVMLCLEIQTSHG
jgi:Zn finger protein HypA/HybF involved in hydrogenase expression